MHYTLIESAFDIEKFVHAKLRLLMELLIPEFVCASSLFIDRQLQALFQFLRGRHKLRKLALREALIETMVAALSTLEGSIIEELECAIKPVYLDVRKNLHTLHHGGYILLMSACMYVCQEDKYMLCPYTACIIIFEHLEPFLIHG